MGSLIKDLRSYNGRSFFADLVAGLTVAIIMIPQGMAYALMAGFPPIYGLYAGLIPLLIYPLFGTSRYLSVGPVALVSIIVLSGLSDIAEPFSAEFIKLAILTSLLAGIFQIALSIFRLGFLVNFLSRPVISGFTSAAAFIIIFSQIKYILGIQLQKSTNIFETIIGLASRITEINLTAFAIGSISLVIIIGLKKISKAIPGSLLVVAIGIALTYFTRIDINGIEIIGAVPSGLPSFKFFDYNYNNIITVLPLAIVICLISFIESLAIGKTLSAKHDSYDINANKELLALGLAKVGGAFFQAFPNTGSFSRSAVNEEAGAKTGLASIIAFIFVALTLLFFTPLFYYLPNAVLGAIVISSVFNLVDLKEIKHLYTTHRGDFFVLITTLLLTIIIGVQNGVFAGIILSLLILIAKVSTPNYAVLGNLKDGQFYRDVTRFPDAITTETRLIIRYDDDIYFGNAQHFFDTVLKEVKKYHVTQELLLDFSSVSNIDSTGLHQLKLLLHILNNKGIELHICGIKGPLRDYFETCGVNDLIDSDHKHWDVKSAIESLDSVG